MYCIKAKISDQNLEVPEIHSVNGTAGIITCHFHFDKTWEKYPIRTAIFGHQIIGEVEVEIFGDDVKVPKEILIKSGIISLALKGMSEDGLKVQRTETQPIIKQKNTLQKGKNAIEPTPDQYAQFIAYVDEKKQNKLVAGDGIKIDPETNVISAIGGSHFGELVKISDWLFDISFNNSDYDFAHKYLEEHYREIPEAGCSAVYKDGLFGKTFDYYYNNYVTFVVHSKGNVYESVGVASNVPKFTREYVERGMFDETSKIIPFFINNGVNEHGVYVGLNLVPMNDTKDGEEFSTRTTGTHPELEPTNTIMLPKLILDKCKTAEEAITLIENTNVYAPNKTVNEECHLFVGDFSSQYVIEFINNEAVIHPDIDFMTNFFIEGATYDEEGKVDWTSLTDHATGMKRNDVIAENFNNIISLQTMEDLIFNKLKFTKAYTDSSDYIDEFIYDYGDIDLTVDKALNHPELFDDVIAEAVDRYLHRTRDGSTWQSVHSVVYDTVNKSLAIVVNEDGVIHNINMKKPTGEVAPATKDTLGGVIVGENLLVDEEGRISVDTADAVEQDNTKPITSAAVHTEVGNIKVVLETI